MDLERIKQNFRIRSGRNKQQKRKSRPTKASPTSQEHHQEYSSQPNGDTPKPQPSTQDTQEGEESASEPRPDEKPEKQQEQSAHTTEDTQEQLQDHSPEASDEPKDSATTVAPEIEQEGQQLDNNQHAPEAEPELQKMAETNSEAEDFDLNPPKPRSKPPSLETLSELLFSSGHLDALLHHPPHLARFSAFLQKYLPQHHPLLSQYLETQKAIKAVAYANAIAEGLHPKATGEGTTTETRRLAASLDSEFEAISNASFRALVGDALPTFVSYSLVKTVSECLTNEITGKTTPIMRDLVDGLSEVFCLTDPNQKDNPIIYASEEFYRLTRYGPEDTLNNNCRFLQGRKTNPDSPKRLKNAIEKGEEINETLLNYRRDGRPFLNLLMVAPLHDRNGKLKYHIGAQVNVTGLIEGGRALEGFQRYLHRRAEVQKKEERQRAQEGLDDDQRRKKQVLARLQDLSETFDLEESAVVQANSRSNSLTRDDDDTGSIGSVERTHRRVYGDSDASGADDDDDVEGHQQNDAADWKLGQAGDGRLSGKLPGVYDTFMLIRPAPSLRIVFVSPKLRKIGNVLQTPFLSHVAAPHATLTGLAESLKAGVPVSAKIHFTAERGENRDGTKLQNGTKHEDGKNGKAIWVSCTPLLGDDDRVGVWMCVVVEKSKIGAVQRRTETRMNKQVDQSVEPTDKDDGPSRGRAEKPNKIEMPARGEDAPIKPVRVDSDTVITNGEAEKPEVGQANAPNNERSAKSIRQMESVYFDAYDGQEPESMTTDPERHVEPTSSSAAFSDMNAQQSTSHDGSPRAVETPVEEYEGSINDAKAYSLPGTDDSPDMRQDFGDEYVNTYSPTTQAQQNDRVVIEDDSDTLGDDNPDIDSSDREHSREPRSPLSMWSPASDIPPSVPSSAQLPDENEDEGQEEDFETPRQIRYTQPVQSSDNDDRSKRQGNIEGNSAFPKDESQEDKSIPDEHQDNMDSSRAAIRDRSKERTLSDGGQQGDLEDSTATLKDLSKDHKSGQNGPQNKSVASTATSKNSSHDWPKAHDEHQDEDRDSAISMDTPEKTRAKSPSSSPSLSAAKQAVHSEIEDVEKEEHQHDVQNWVHDARPPSSKQDSRMKMDYLRAGGTRWRPPGLGRDAQKEEGDGSTDFDPCVTSPYSVD